jgi:hypothetical protein
MNEFSPASADAAHARLAGDTSVIPEGMYCYSRKGFDAESLTLKLEPCPYWGHDPARGEQQSGYCAHLRAGDWEEGGTMLLWDMVKECGVRDRLPGEDE